MKIDRSAKASEVAARPVPVMSLAVLQVMARDGELALDLERLRDLWVQAIARHEARQASAQSTLELGR